MTRVECENSAQLATSLIPSKHFERQAHNSDVLALLLGSGSKHMFKSDLHQESLDAVSQPFKKPVIAPLVIHTSLR